MPEKSIKTGQPVVGVSAIIFDNDSRVLLVKRGKPPRMGQWTAPGGKQETGESITDACIREVREETGIDTVKIISLLAVVERRFEEFHYVILDFLATLPENANFDLTPADDVSDARWVPYSQLNDYDLVEGLLPIIEVGLRSVAEQKSLGLFDVTGRGSDFIPLA